MSERPATRINLERYLDRLDRPAKASEAALDSGAPSPPPEALALLARLTESVARLPSGAGEGVKPLLEQVRVHVEALFPTVGAASLDDQAHAAHKETLEELFQTLEGVLYACSLPAR